MAVTPRSVASSSVLGSATRVPLEEVLQRELHDPRIRSRGDLAEQRVGERRVRRADRTEAIDPLRHARSHVVEQVECFETQLELLTSRYREAAAERRVDAPRAG